MTLAAYYADRVVNDDDDGGDGDEGRDGADVDGHGGGRRRPGAVPRRSVLRRRDREGIRAARVVHRPVRRQRHAARRRGAAASPHRRTGRCLRPISASAYRGSLGSRVLSVPDSGAEGPGFKSQSRRCRVTVLGKLFTPIVSMFTKQRNW